MEISEFFGDGDGPEIEGIAILKKSISRVESSRFQKKALRKELSWMQTVLASLKLHEDECV